MSIDRIPLRNCKCLVCGFRADTEAEMLEHIAREHSEKESAS